MKDAAAATQRSGSRLTGLLAGLVLLALTSAACLLLMEGAVRLLFPFFSPKAQVPFAVNSEGVPLGISGQTVRQATPKGDYDTMVHFNALGLRDAKDLQGSKDTDWFAVGDSFTMGWGVD